MTLGTEPYKGVRDFYPDDYRSLAFFKHVSREILQQYGFEEYMASPLEPAELYESKTSDEIVNEQTYTFQDRGDRKVTLRPEMTPTFARMVAGKKRELPFPIRWFSIPNVFRYERPQRGRLREHYQLNIDIVGIEGVEAELELLMIATALFEKAGAKPGEIDIRVNDRRMINAALEKAGLSGDEVKTYMRLLDRKPKMTAEEYDAALGELLVGRPDPESFMGELTPELTELLTMTRALGIPASYDATITRGFDYYTGIVFEVFDTHKDNQRALAGGGRYDTLLSLFGDESIPATGFAVGDVTFRDFLEVRGIKPPRVGCDIIAIIPQTRGERGEAQSLAFNLRAAGLSAITLPYQKTVGDSYALAEKKGATHALIISEAEAMSGNATIRSIAAREDKEVKLSASAIKSLLCV